MSVELRKAVLSVMVETCEQLLDLTHEYSFDDFVDDEETCDEVYHNLILLGEASSRLPEKFMQRHKEIPWEKMIATKEGLESGFDVIDDYMVWTIVRTILPDLHVQLKALLAELC
ncbi:MAG: DUF86 domain-containing protein [Flavobacteriales bacterium]|nr:DUF86 domain-containing protein [Flavobacteriales bacterium]